MRTRSIDSLPGVLTDTSAYFSLFDTRDPQHQVASRVSTQLAAAHWRLITTNFVVAETHALLLNRLSNLAARRFLYDIYHSPTVVVRVDEADEARARQIIFRQTDKDFSLVDATSF